MITVTNTAKEYLKNTLLAHTDDLEASLRLAANPGGQLVLGLGREAEGDEVVEHDGIKVLLVGRKIATVLDGQTLDVGDTPEGPKLSISKQVDGGR